MHNSGQIWDSNFVVHSHAINCFIPNTKKVIRAECQPMLCSFKMKHSQIFNYFVAGLKARSFGMTNYNFYVSVTHFLTVFLMSFMSLMSIHVRFFVLFAQIFREKSYNYYLKLKKLILTLHFANYTWIFRSDAFVKCIFLISAKQL